MIYFDVSFQTNCLI